MKGKEIFIVFTHSPEDEGPEIDSIFASEDCAVGRIEELRRRGLKEHMRADYVDSLTATELRQQYAALLSAKGVGFSYTGYRVGP